MIIAVTNVKYLEKYKLDITFNDGEKKIVDLEKHLTGEIFEPLKNIEYFKTVKVVPELDTICWDNGADMAPDFLYSIGKKGKLAS